MSTPETFVELYGVPFKPDYSHTVFFSSEKSRISYFEERLIELYTGVSYYKGQGSLQLKADMIGVTYVNRTWNYAKIKNPGDRKRFYFVKATRYVNDHCIELDLELDVIQTYMFDTSFAPCYVERQHTETDEIGEHTLDEGLELGELVNNYVADIQDLKKLVIMHLTSVGINPITGRFTDLYCGEVIDNVLMLLHTYATDPDRINDFGDYLVQLEDAGKIDAIVTMWMYPRALVELREGESWDDELESVTDFRPTLHQPAGARNVEVTVAKRYELDGYTPRNNKLYCYPYNFLYISNNSGSGAAYRYERFEGDVCHFMLKGSITPDAGVRMEPNLYNGTGDNYDEGISLGGFPMCAWSGDPYKIWLAQNSNQLQLGQTAAGIKIASGAVAALGSIASGNLIGAGAGASVAYSGYQQIVAQNAQKADLDVQPPQARGSLSVSVNAAHGKLTFTAYFKSVNAEHARIIDDFFTMYGYKVNRVQIPNRSARSAFTYVKTVGCTLNNSGVIPAEDAERICAIHDRGITYWNQNATLGDYSTANPCV